MIICWETVSWRLSDGEWQRLALAQAFLRLMRDGEICASGSHKQLLKSTEGVFMLSPGKHKCKPTQTR